MKRFSIFVFILFFASLLYGQKLKIRIVLNNAPPFRIISGDHYSGIYVDIIKAAAKEMNAELEFIEVPFKRALVMMEMGEADMMLGPNKNSERKEYMYYLLNTPLPRANKAFYLHPSSRDIEEYNNLYGKSIAVLRGAAYFDKFDTDQNLNKCEFSDYKTGIRMVNAKRIDVLIMPEFSGDYSIKNMGMSLQKSSLIIEGNVSFVTISKKSTLIYKSKIVEDALNSIKRDGVVEDIIKKYR